MYASLTKTLRALRVNTVPGVKKIAIAVIGGTVLIFGIALIVLPGPAFLVIPAGLAILATEFVWARRWLLKVREYANRAKNKLIFRAAPPKPQEEAELSPSASPRTK
jgi:tellurite resistance protein TerC